jgi:hypothetical protein
MSGDPREGRGGPADDPGPADHPGPGDDPESGAISEAEAASIADGSTIHPAGFCRGPGLIVVYGNAAFRELFGAACVGMPAREAMVGLSKDAFTAMDTVLDRSRAGARWVRLNGAQWRLTMRPMQDPGTAETYGLAFHLRPRDEEPPAGS